MNEFFEEIEGLTLDRSKYCMLGQFCRAFLEKTPVITQKLIPHIEQSLDCKIFQSKVLDIYTESYEIQRKTLLKEIEERYSHPSAIAFYFPMLERVSKKLSIKTFKDLVADIEYEKKEYTGTLEILNNSYRNIHGVDGMDYISEKYAIYYLGSLLYSKYISSRARMDFFDLKYSGVVLNEYSRIGIDLKKEDTQFLKYNLLSVGGYVRINNDKDSQTIIDDRIGKYFWINVPRKLLLSIEDLINREMISEISFRVDYVSELIPIMEEMEFGSTLKLKISTLPELSKFYSSSNYSNSLWVRHDKGKLSLTFEELVDSFEVTGDDVVTQVVHLEYFSEGEQFFISHMDHEFILYSIDEYEKRLTTPDIKGYKKIKTFKIDNAKIPFGIKFGNDYFLIQILDSYFINTDLVLEYFEKI